MFSEQNLSVFYSSSII